MNRPRFLTALFAFAGLALGSACGTATGARTALPARPADAPKPAAEPTSAYLFVHFTGESPLGEQIYFSVSKNGLDWTDLNDSQPVLLSTLGEKGVRDPAIIRSADGKKFYILATDLRIASGKGWDVARFEASTSLIFWESTDLVNWSAPWSVKVADAIPGAGCVWAPEAIYDEEREDYFVYWATISPLGGVREARIYYSRTKDFRSFTPAQLYIERVGEGVNAKDIIDTQIIEVKGARHRFYRSSRDAHITLEGSDSLLGAWERIGDLSYLGYTAREVEGPILFQFNEEKKWGLLVDQYAAGKGYLPLVSGDLDAPRGFGVLPASAYSLGASKKRHGGILNITRREYDALLAKWPTQPPVRLSSVAQPDRLLRHANFQLRLDHDIQPAEDGRWRLVPGLASGADAVSFRSVNFPDHHLVWSEGRLALAADDGRDDYASRATFRRVNGLAGATGFSFRLSGHDDLYLLAQDDVLSFGRAASDLERRRATFQLID